jgi:hypothetical protein
MIPPLSTRRRLNIFSEEMIKLTLMISLTSVWLLFRKKTKSKLTFTRNPPYHITVCNNESSDRKFLGSKFRALYSGAYRGLQDRGRRNIFVCINPAPKHPRKHCFFDFIDQKNKICQSRGRNAPFDTSLSLLNN